MVMLVTSVTAAPVRCANWLTARLWSRRVIAVKLPRGMRFAFWLAMYALVLQGLPTTSTRASAEATSSIAVPWPMKIRPLSFSRSLRSMPGPRGLLPTRKTASASAKAVRSSSVEMTSGRSGYAQSRSSISTPLRPCRAIGSSRSCRITGVSFPKTSPLAMGKMRL